MTDGLAFGTGVFPEVSRLKGLQTTNPHTTQNLPPFLPSKMSNNMEEVTTVAAAMDDDEPDEWCVQFESGARGFWEMAERLMSMS